MADAEILPREAKKGRLESGKFKRFFAPQNLNKMSIEAYTIGIRTHEERHEYGSFQEVFRIGKISSRR